MHTVESHLIQQSPGNTRPVEFAGGVFRNSTLRPDQWGHATHRSSSHKRKLRITTFIQWADQLQRRSRPPSQPSGSGPILLLLPRRTMLHRTAPTMAIPIRRPSRRRPRAAQPRACVGRPSSTDLVGPLFLRSFDFFPFPSFFFLF
jgi:hypothetical protein